MDDRSAPALRTSCGIISMNQITTTKAAHLPAPISAKIPDYAASLIRRGVASWSISDRRAPVGADLIALRDREKQLRASLEPAPINAIQNAVLRMFLGFPSAANLDAAGTAAAYASALSIYPAWAIGAACGAAVRGELGNPSFAPSVAELAKYAQAKIATVETEARTINRILTADVFHEPSPEESERVAAALRQLATDLGMTTWGKGGEAA